MMLEAKGSIPYLQCRDNSVQSVNSLLSKEYASVPRSLHKKTCSVQLMLFDNVNHFTPVIY